VAGSIPTLSAKIGAADLENGMRKWKIKVSVIYMNKKFQQLPSVSEVLKHTSIHGFIETKGHSLVVYAIRKSIQFARSNIDFHAQTRGTKKQTDLINLIVSKTIELIHAISGNNLKPVINATGIILHTNLGRAPLGEKAIHDALEVMSGYSNLEFDLKTGKRGKRSDHITDILKYLTGAEDAIVVNNNAAAIILALNTLAKDKEVIISRGELIEIGDSFRIPDIIKAADVKMVEVGTTNKTNLSDYEKAISNKTGLIIKVHQSNYIIKGFTKEVSIADLAKLAHSKKLPLIYDIGSGLLRRHEKTSSQSEPDVKSAIASGADLVMFSCDKLLGGLQAGIIVGKTKFIGKLAKAPLMRALRVGKLTLITLINACRYYLEENSLIDNNPVFLMLEKDSNYLLKSAEELAGLLKKEKINCSVEETKGACGGGSLPEMKLKSYSVVFGNSHSSPKNKETLTEHVFHNLLNMDRPIIPVLKKGKLYFDMLTIGKKDISYIASSIVHHCKSYSQHSNDNRLTTNNEL